MMSAARCWFWSVVALAAVGSLPTTGVAQEGHAHNDYLHPRPLLDALDQGFTSVEADIYLVDDDLWVAHDRIRLSPDRTLRRLYLEPLRKRIAASRGGDHPPSVLGDGRPFTLLVDIKSDGKTTYQALAKVLAEYDDVFTHSAAGKVQTRPVTAIISGNRDVDTIADDSTRFAGIDGRLSDLNTSMDASLMPLISDHWGRNFRWRGDGPMSPEEAEKLAGYVQAAHAKNRKIRFWAIPDQPAVWRTLADAGVDLINTDNLSGLGDFLRSRDR